MSLVVV